MSADSSGEWDLVDVLEPEAEADAGHAPDTGHAPEVAPEVAVDTGHAPEAAVQTTLPSPEVATQTDLPTGFPALDCVRQKFGPSLCMQCLEDCEKCYVVWRPKRLAGIHCGRNSWKYIEKGLGGGYCWANGHRLQKVERSGATPSPILAAVKVYSAEVRKHEVYPDPVCYHHQ